MGGACFGSPMRSVTASPPRRSLLLASAVGLLALAGCSLDLDLPGAPTSPTVTDFSPRGAYAGQLVRVVGSHFEADAAANTVNFALASARGDRWEGATLVVRVPADAGVGPITVSNRDGTSGPTEAPFDYRGLGEPRRVQIASSTPILHHPRAVRPAVDDVVIDSALYGGLVWSRIPSIAPGVTQSAADASQQFAARLAYSDTDPVTGLPRLVLADGQTGAVFASRLLTYVPSQIIVQPPQARVLVFGWNEVDGVEEVSGFAEMDLAPIFPPITYGMEFFFGATNQGNGAVVIAGMNGPDYDLVMIRSRL